MLLPITLAACGQSEPVAPGPAMQDEAAALSQAGEMLDARPVESQSAIAEADQS